MVFSWDRRVHHNITWFAFMNDRHLRDLAAPVTMLTSRSTFVRSGFWPAIAGSLRSVSRTGTAIRLFASSRDAASSVLYGLSNADSERTIRAETHTRYPRTVETFLGFIGTHSHRDVCYSSPLETMRCSLVSPTDTPLI